MLDGSIVATVDGAGNVTYLAQSMLRTTKMTVSGSGSGAASGVATYYPYGAQNASIAAEYKFTNQMRGANGIDHFSAHGDSLRACRRETGWGAGGEDEFGKICDAARRGRAWLH